MDRDHAPQSTELEQVAEAHLPDALGAKAGPVSGGTVDTAGGAPVGSTPTPTATSGRAFDLPKPTVLTWQDLLDLPGQILPDETVYHLRNAGREALLAAYSLWRNIRKAAAGPPEDKVRKHIDVE
jgi:hypothetical protein